MAGNEKTGPEPFFRVLSDDEFLGMVADKGYPEELNQAMLQLRREGRIQFFDDGTGDPLVIKAERVN